MLPFTCGPVPVKSNSTFLLLPCGGTVTRSLIGMLVVPTPSSSITSSKVYSPGGMRVSASSRRSRVRRMMSSNAATSIGTPRASIISPTRRTPSRQAATCAK